MSGPFSAAVAVPSARPALAEPGAAALIQTTALPTLSSTSRPWIAHVYDNAGATFKGLLQVLNRPPLQYTLNGGYHPMTLQMAAPQRQAVWGGFIYGQTVYGTNVGFGDQIRITEQGGDGSVIYTGIVEDAPDTVAAQGTAFELVLTPLVTVLGDTYFNKAYTTPVDVATMVADIANTTRRLATSPQTVALTGVTGAYVFNNTTCLDALHICRLIAGVNFAWFVDAIGQLWFQRVNTASPTYTIKQIDYERRKRSANIQKLKNYIKVVGGVAAGASAPVVSLYSSTSSQKQYGTRTLDPSPVFKTVTDQGTLDSIAATYGAAFDRVMTSMEIDLPNFGKRINLAQSGMASARVFEPSSSPFQEAETGTGAYSQNFVVLEVTVDGPRQKVKLGDVPINGIDDYRYEIDRIIQRTSLDSLFNTPMSGTQVQTLAGGGYQTSSDTGSGRIKADGTAIRGFDGTSTNYGLPDGVGESFRFGVDGIAYLAKLVLQTAASGGRIIIDSKTDPANPLITVYDGSGTARAQMGSLPANGISGAQFGFRANAADGTPLFDSLGLISVMKALLTSEGTGQTVAGVAGAYPQWQTLRSSTFVIPTGRTLSVLLVAMVTGYEYQTVVAPVVIQPNIRCQVVGQKTVLGGIPVSGGGSTIGTATMIALVPSLAAGTYTADLSWASLSSTSDNVSTYDERLYVFQLGS